MCKRCEGSTDWCASVRAVMEANTETNQCQVGVNCKIDGERPRFGETFCRTRAGFSSHPPSGLGALCKGGKHSNAGGGTVNNRRWPVTKAAPVRDVPSPSQMGFARRAGELCNLCVCVCFISTRYEARRSMRNGDVQLSSYSVTHI